jgi:hypothetical protein
VLSVLGAGGLGQLEIRLSLWRKKLFKFFINPRPIEKPFEFKMATPSTFSSFFSMMLVRLVLWTVAVIRPPAADCPVGLPPASSCI